MKKNKILSMILSIAMLLSCLPGIVNAEETDATTTDVTLPFRIDFDGNDTRTDYQLGKDTNPSAVITPRIVDGCWDVNVFDVSYNCPVVWFKNMETAQTNSNDGGILLSEHDNLVVRTRFKMGTDTTKPIDLDTHIFGVRDFHVNFAFWAWCHEGTLAYGQVGNNAGQSSKKTVTTDYKMYQGTWYTIEVVYKKDFGWVTNVIPDEGEPYYGTVPGSPNYGLSRIKMIDFFNTAQVGSDIHTYIDYVEMYDPDKLPKPTVTYNGAELNGKKDLPESFEATMVFNSAITEADLKDITIDNGAILEKTLSDDGKTVTLNISNIVNGNKYSLKTSKIGVNANSETVFFAKEADWVVYRAEFDGGDKIVDNALADFYTYANDDNKSNIPVSKIANGELVINNPGNQPRFLMINDLSSKIPEGSTILWETRMKRTKQHGDVISVDGVDCLTGDANNAFMRMDMNLGITALDGYFAYVRSQGASSCTKTDYLLKAGEYYTYKIEYDASNSKARFSVEHDTDGSYTTDWISIDMGGYTQEYKKWQFGYIYHHTVAMDYTRIYNLSALPAPSVKLADGTDLDGAQNVAEDSVVNVDFESAITEDDLEKITIDNGATLSKELSGDRKTVTVKVKNTRARSKYTLSVAAIGNNIAKEATFFTADAPWVLYRAEFDGLDPFAPIEGGGEIADGFWNTSALYANSTAMINISSNPVNLTGFNNVTFETRVKWDNYENDSNDDATNPNDVLNNGNPMLRILKLDSNSSVQMNMKDGVLYTGGISTGGGDTDTGITLYENKWYIIKITEFANKNTFKVKITDEETGETYTATGASHGFDLDTINKFSFGYRAQKGTTVDYIRIVNDDLLPTPEILLNGESLDGQRRVPGDVMNFINVKFKNPITEADLSKIKIDGNEFASAMLEDAYTASMILEGCEEPRTFHTITVDDIGDNKGIEATFRTADEGKYFLKAEFDGYDDDSVFYVKNQNVYEKLDNDSTRIKDGIMNHRWSDGPYRQLVIPFDIDWNGKTANVKNTLPLDVADKSNIKLETRIKWGAEGNLDHRAIMLDNYLAYFTIKDGCFKYSTNSNGDGGKCFEREGEPISVERDTWYEISMTLNFKDQVYCINIIREGEADVYSSPWISMSELNGAAKSTINEVSFAWHHNNNIAPMYIDYIRLSDENYGVADVTYGDGIALGNSALVPVSGETVKVEMQQEAYTGSGITLKEVGGNNVEISPVANGSKVITIALPTLKYDTKYELFVPASVSGAIADQKVTFRTVHDASAELSLPAEFAVNKFSADNKLDVAYFGGSITANPGWRDIVEDWFDETYGAGVVNHHNVSIGGTGSDYGRIRLYKDVVSKNPDIVFVEFAVNDSSSYSADYSMESIVRALNTLEKPPVIIYVYTTVRNFEKNNNAIILHDKVAEAYGIPVINIRDFVMSKANTDATFKNAWEKTNDYISSDNTHPAQGASELYGNYVTSLLTANATKYFVRAKSNDEVEPIANGTDYFFKNIERSEDAMNAIDDSYSFTVNGDEVLIEFKRTAGVGGIAEVTIDGVIKETVNTYYASYVPNTLSTYSDLGSGEHTVTVKVIGKSDASSSYNVDVVRTYEPIITYKAPEFDVPQFTTDTITEGVDLKMTTSYVAYDSEDVTLIIALYDKDGRFVRMTKVETSAEKGEGELELSITPKAGEVKAKAFIWNSVSEMKPFTVIDSIGF